MPRAPPAWWWALALARERLPRAAAIAVVLVVLDVGAANVRAYVLSPREVLHPSSRLIDFLREEPGWCRSARTAIAGA